MSTTRLVTYQSCNHCCVVGNRQWRWQWYSSLVLALAPILASSLVLTLAPVLASSLVRSTFPSTATTSCRIAPAHMKYKGTSQGTSGTKPHNRSVHRHVPRKTNLVEKQVIPVLPFLGFALPAAFWGRERSQECSPQPHVIDVTLSDHCFEARFHCGGRLSLLSDANIITARS